MRQLGEESVCCVGPARHVRADMPLNKSGHPHAWWSSDLPDDLQQPHDRKRRFNKDTGSPESRGSPTLHSTTSLDGTLAMCAPSAWQVSQVYGSCCCCEFNVARPSGHIDLCALQHARRPQHQHHTLHICESVNFKSVIATAICAFGGHICNVPSHAADL